MTASIKGIGVAVNTNDYAGDLARFDDYLTFVESTGADYAEFGAHGLDIIVNARHMEKRVREVERICSDHDLRYTLHAPAGLNFMDDRYPGLQQDVARSLIDLGARTGAELLVIHAGRAPGDGGVVPSGEMRRKERHALVEVGDIGAESGVKIAVENLNAMAISGGLQSTGVDLGVLSAEIAEIDHPNVGLALDVSHALSAAGHLGRDYLESIKVAAPQVTHIHLNDSAAKPNYEGFPNRYQDRVVFGIDDLHLPVGWGEIDYGSVFALLAPKEPVIMTLEIDPRYGAEIEASVARARELADSVNLRAVSG